MSHNYSVTENQIVFGTHDDGFLKRGGTRLRVERVTGCSPLQHYPMKGIIANAIDDAERSSREHTQRKNAHFSGSTSTDSNDTTSSSDSSASKALSEMLGDTETDTDSDASETRTDGGAAATSGDSWIVPPNQVKLLELTDDSRVRSTVYPRTFRCPRCQHFEFHDPASGDLNCPDCSGTLRQYPIVYACPRCANVEQMQPQQSTLGNAYTGTVQCESCSGGHYHLSQNGSLSNAAFVCDQCGDTQSLRRICRECHIPSDEDGENGAPSVMKPTPTDAGSLVSPMVRSALFIDETQISLEALHSAHEQGHDPYRWGADQLPDSDQDLLTAFMGIADLFTVTDIQSLTAVYGYQTRVTAEGTDITDGDRLTRTFDHDDGMKRAYATQSRGRGLVFDLDTGTLQDVVEELSDATIDSYTDLAERELAVVNEQPVKELVDDEHDIVLIPLLHALEHALFDAATHEIGMDDVIGSKLLVEDGAIVLYERENVGSGGLAQLTLDSDGKTLKRFLRKAVEQIETCGQFCEDGCPACLYSDDFDCRPYLPREVDRWVPPNALLSRQYAQTFINAN